MKCSYSTVNEYVLYICTVHTYKQHLRMAKNKLTEDASFENKVISTRTGLLEVSISPILTECTYVRVLLTVDCDFTPQFSHMGIVQSVQWKHIIPVDITPVCVLPRNNLPSCHMAEGSPSVRKVANNVRTYVRTKLLHMHCTICNSLHY